MTEIKPFTLPAKILLAAAMCQASQKEVRYYLRGISVDSRRIAATTGHYMFVNYTENWPTEFKNKFPPAGLIINIDGKIPKKADIAKFTPIKDGFGFVEYKSRDEKHVGRSLFSIIDGKFPDVEKITKTNGDADIDTGLYDANYIAKIGSVFAAIGSPKFPSVKLTIRGKDKVLLSTKKHAEFGLCEMYLMPRRE